MEKPTSDQTNIIYCYTTIFVLGFIAFSASTAAEFKRTKVEDLKLDGNMCWLPGSPAYGLGITACICLLAAQIIGTFAVGPTFYLSLFHKEKKTLFHQHKEGSGWAITITITLLALSWFTLGVTVLLLGVGTSMNKQQQYGEGWLNRECYVVRRGVFVGAAFLGLLAILSHLCFLFRVTGRGSLQADDLVSLSGRVYTQKSSETSSPP